MNFNVPPKLGTLLYADYLADDVDLLLYLGHTRYHWQLLDLSNDFRVRLFAKPAVKDYLSTTYNR